MNVFTHAYNVGFFWGAAMGCSVGLMIGMAVSFSQRRKCEFCGRRHWPRPEDMTAMEYMRFLCRGYRPHKKEEPVC